MRSSTEPRGRRPESPRAAVEDLRALLAFRSSSLSDAVRRRLRVAAWSVLVVTVALVLAAAYLPGEVRPDSGNILALLPTSMAVFLALACFAAVAAAGGRELVAREEAVAFPISSTTEHLGALLLAPLNVAWLLQSWVLLGMTAYAFGPGLLPVYLLPLVLWLVLATAVGQVVGWAVEGVRRARHGAAVFRTSMTLLALAATAVVAGGWTDVVLDSLPTGYLLDAIYAGAGGDWLLWAAAVLALLALVVAAVVVGAVPARWALQRPMRSELGLEGGRHRARPMPRSDLGAVLRIDRASVWRSVPLRRGALVLAVVPGLVALAGDMPWHLATVLPGLVAAGGALLFGVNAWCLDARGALWRESLPVAPRTVFWVRALVLVELLAGSALATVLLVSLRAGLPTLAELAALVGCAVVVVAQVVSGSMRWSVARPAAVDLRSARATPAPPVAMVGYSARLALVTTLTGLLFSGLALIASPALTVWVALVLATVSVARLERVASRWAVPEERARVVSIVAG